MNGVTAKGQTVDAAVQIALTKLGVSQSEVDIHILEESKKGFLGFIGKKMAVVEVTIKKRPEKEAEAYLKSIIHEMNIEADVVTEVKGRNIIFTLSGEQVALLIGKRGATLNALQFLTQHIANRYSKQFVNVAIDAENYREKRKNALEVLAKRIAKQVNSTQKKVVLEPMLSHERKIIHQVLSNDRNITTASEGLEPNRYIVIYPK